MNELVRLAKEHLGRSQPAQPCWLTTWRELAEITSGLTADDPRLPPMLAALQSCDTAFAADNWLAFQESRQEVLRVMQMGFNRGTHQPTE